jgi:hypothetical protein
MRCIMGGEVERNLPSEELLTELRTPAERYEDVLKTIFEEAAILSKKLFTSYDEAEEASQAFDHRITVLTDEVEGAPFIEVSLSGDKVLLPTLSIVKFHDAESNEIGLKVILKADEPLAEMESFESVDAFIVGAWHVVKESQGTYKSCPYLVADLKQPGSSQIEFSDSGYNIADLEVTKKAFVAIHSSNEIVVNELVSIRHNQQLIDNISKYGMANSIYENRLNKLRQIFHSESTVGFKDMKKIKILHSVAQHGERHARKGYEYSLAAREALLSAIGKGRTVSVTFSKYEAEDITVNQTLYGDIYSVLMPDGPEDDMEPSLVIDAYLLKDDSKTIVQVPIEKITSFSF